MPRRDQTGPSGQGSLTGRQMGSCATANSSRTINRFFKNLFKSHGTYRIGGRLGLGQRFRFRNFHGPIQNMSLDKSGIENDIQYLKEQIKLRENELKKIDEKKNE
jgi:hypothetical protein